MNTYRSMLPAAIVSLLAASHAAGAPLCKPELTVKDVTFSPIHNLQRTWTARIAVDAARCATESGRFQVNFVRLKETAPDMDFTEQFSWTAHQNPPRPAVWEVLISVAMKSPPGGQMETSVPGTIPRAVAKPPPGT